MYQITIVNDIRGNAYNELIEYLIRKCDSFLFHLPNMGKLLINERNAEFFPEYSVGYTEEKDQEKHRRYIKKVEPLLDIISNDITERWKDTGYLDQTSNIEMEIFQILISEQTCMFFANTESILSWKYPDLPEDPCFMCDEVCIFQCIAHEGLCFFYSTDPWIFDFLKKYNIDFFISN